MEAPQEACHKAGDPGTCSPEQVLECHGTTEAHECEGEGCERQQHPERCSPEQIRECHGDAEEHPCVVK